MLVDQKNKERIQEFKETKHSRYIYQNKRDRACFKHDMGYVDLEDLTRKTASDKILCDKAFDIAQNSKYGWYQRGLASMDYKFCHKKNLLRVEITLLVEQPKMKMFLIKN